MKNKGFLISILFVILVGGCGIFALSYANSEDVLIESNADTSQEASLISESASEVEEIRGVWFCYNEWKSIFQGTDEDTFRARVNQVLDNIQSINCNALFIQVRAFGDAMYPSSYYPWSKYCAGEVGQSPDYDPLRIITELGKEKGVQIHAWINPLRIMDDDDFAKVSDQYLIKQWYNSPNRSDYFMKDSNGRYILIPTNPEVRKLICDGIAELMNNYDLAGIHIDDYFYPSGIDTLQENDIPYYQKQNPGVEIGQWRRNGTSSLVREIYQTVKSINPNAMFGVSPQANLTNDYDKMFIDVPQWIQEGYVDYMMPQIYFGFENTALPFNSCAQTWNDLDTNPNVSLYAGLAAYKIGLESDAHAGAGEKEWYNVAQGSNDMLKRQIECIHTMSNYDGFCLYSYGSLFLPDGTRNPITTKEVDNLLELF